MHLQSTFGQDTFLRSPLVRGFVALLIRWCWRCSDSRAGLVVCYHSIRDTPEKRTPELVPSIGVPLFRKQLAHLRKAYRVVPLAQVREAAKDRRRGQRFPIAISFDDDLASHASSAVPELRRAGLPATFFLSGASLTRPYCFWWEDLQALVSKGQTLNLRRLAHVQPAITMGNLKGVAASIERLAPEERDEVASELRELASPPPEKAGIRANEVQKIARMGFEVGFHTRGHYLLTNLSDQQVHDQLCDGRKELEAVTGQPMRALAYPHGGADRRVALAARTAGYTEAFTSEPTAITPTANPHLLGRVDASPTSRGHLALMLARALALRS
jgi:peptidoglycan/xylan/chitin deacetylase (PgdA/CDA1 family)